MQMAVAGIDADTERLNVGGAQFFTQRIQRRHFRTSRRGEIERIKEQHEVLRVRKLLEADFAVELIKQFKRGGLGANFNHVFSIQR